MIIKILSDYKFLIPVIISVISLIYTWRSNQNQITISDEEIENYENKPNMFSFKVHNLSNTPVKINNVIIYDSKNKIVPDNKFIPADQVFSHGSYSISYAIPPNHWEYSEPFIKPKILAPFNSIDFSYYINEDQKPDKLKIVCNKRINGFKKSKLFPIHFYQ